MKYGFEVISDLVEVTHQVVINLKTIPRYLSECVKIYLHRLCSIANITTIWYGPYFDWISDIIWSNSTDAVSLKSIARIEWPVGDPNWSPKKIKTCNFSSADTLKCSFIDDSENFVCAREQLLHLKSQNSTLISLDLKWINFNAKV